MLIINRHDIERILDDSILPRLARYTEYRVGNEISHGHYGIAFELKNDPQRILKVTADRDEARTSSKLVGKKFKHIVDIYRVFEFKTLQGAYFLIEEKLKPLSSQEALVVALMGFPSTDLIGHLMQHDVKTFDLHTLEGLKAYASKRLQLEPAQFVITKLWPEIRTLDPLTIAFIVQLLTWRSVSEFQKVFMNEDAFHTIQEALAGIKEMEENHIVFSDTQAVNLMKDSQGTFKWIDLGAGSGAPGQVQIEQTEGRCR